MIKLQIPMKFQLVLLKKSKYVIYNVSKNIFHQILYESLIPDSLINGLVSPLYKGKGSKTDLINYKPISLLNLFSKIFEKAIKTRLINYLEENDLLPISQ